MFHIALYEPEIPPNTGNIIRLCANTGNQLHLIKPLGFDLDDARLRRAGLDYQEYATVKQHDNFSAFMDAVTGSRVYALSTKGRQNFYATRFQQGDVFLFGPETRGLPESIRQQLGNEQVLRMPMMPESRSLNLSNTAAVVVYEAWRQNDFCGAVL